MGELDKQLLESVKTFKQTAQGMQDRIKASPDLLVQAFISGYFNGIEAMREYTFTEGLDLGGEELLSEQAKAEASRI